MNGYLDREAALPYCAGCGHPHVLKALDEALVATALPPQRVALVTDIGCVGLADAYFPALHTVHTLHGRAAAVAAGLRLAAKDTAGGPLKPIVLVGDGGATIGLLHLVHAAQMDVDVTVLVHNNLVYGMTGGQHSGLTPEGLRTTTTPDGCPFPPLDLGKVLEGAGASFFARTRAPGADLASTIADAILHPGFACVEILELCPTFAARVGGMTGKGLEEMITARGLAMGRLARTVRPRLPAVRPADEDPLGAPLLAHVSRAALDRTVHVVAAGRAGERVQSAARFVATAGAAAALHVAVQTDNPVTQGKGFSLAEITLSPEPIAYAGLVDPDLVVVVAGEGLAEVERRGLLAPEAKVGHWLLDASLTPPPAIASHAARHDLRQRYGPKNAALGGLAEEVGRAGWWSVEAWQVALDGLAPASRAETAGVLAKAGIPVRTDGGT